MQADKGELAMRIKGIQLNLTLIEFEQLKKKLNGDARMTSIMVKMEAIQARLDVANKFLERHTETG
jgi:hypothetical protein